MTKLEEIVSKFQKLPDWEERYQTMIALGKELPPMPEELHQEKYKIRGCQSQVWLYPELKDGKVYFLADSDALLVKGIVAILVNVYSGLTPTEILNTKSDFLKEIGITEHLSMNRTNGLQHMLKQIQLYALVYSKMNG